MIIELTVAQAEALDNPMFAKDDALRQFPIPLVGNLGVLTDERDNVTGYVMAHESLTFEDEVVLHTILDDRAAEIETVRKLDTRDRAAAEATITTRISKDTKKSARYEASDKKAALVEMRADILKDTRIVALLAAKVEESRVDDAKVEESRP